MSKSSPKSFPSEWLLPRLALHSLVLIVVVLLPCTTPSLGLRNSSESEAPVDEDESLKKEAISTQARTRIGRSQPGRPLLMPVLVGLRCSAGISSFPRSGHRLPNNLLAPLRC